METDMPAENGVRAAKRKGGEARARSLSPAERSDLAAKAARSRWDSMVPIAEHGSVDRPLRIGALALQCYVLTGGIRVFSQRGLLDALGLGLRGAQIDRLLEQASLNRHLTPEAFDALRNPLQFRIPRGGRTAYGYPATLLIDVCNAVLDASQAGDLPKAFDVVAARSDIIVRAVAKVGIIALVDEATGYDENREETLQAILEMFLRKELAAWMKRFPDEYYEQICRLKGWQWRGRPTPTPYAIAGITSDLVYRRLAPGILAELEKINPKVETRRRAKHHQFLTEEVGHPALAQHLHTLVSFMRVSDSWDHLVNMVDRALPRQNENIQLRLMEGEGAKN